MRRLAGALALLAVLPAAASLGCATDGDVGELSYAASAKENYDKGLEELEDGNHLEAMKYFDHVRTKYPYSSFAALAELKVADAQFAREKFLEAIDAYRNFIKFHPTHPNVDWAAFRIGEAHMEGIPSDFFLFPPSIEKDQTEARAAKTALEEFVSRYPKSAYLGKAKQLLAGITQKLAEHEAHVARFYARREKWEAVVGRYEYLLRYYPGVGYDAEASLGLARAYRELGDPAKARASLERFLKANPGAPEAGEAKALLRELG